MSNPAISEKSSVQIGLVLGGAGFLIGCIWWAATMQTKTDMVLHQLEILPTFQLRVTETETKLRLLEQRVLQNETAAIKK